MDPYAEKKSPWPPIIAIVVAALVLGGCWYFGKMDKVLPPKVRSTSVLGTNAPAYVAPTNVVQTVTVSTNAPAAK